MLVCDLECYLLCCLLSNFLISNSYNLSRNLKTPKHSQLVDHLLSDPGSHNTEISAYRLKGELFFSFQINLLQIALCIFILLFCVRQFHCFLMLLYCIVNGLQRGFCLFNSCCQTKVGKRSLLIHVQIWRRRYRIKYQNGHLVVWLGFGSCYMTINRKKNHSFLLNQ